jgi:hypothetical protein
MADTTRADMIRDRQRKMMEALHDDPGGLQHPIWAELGIDPIPPISAEEEWLIDEAIRTENWDLVNTKVWDRDADGNLFKLWTLGNLTEAPACIQEFIAQHPGTV